MEVISYSEPQNGSIRVQKSRGFAIVTINREEKRNALSRELWRKLYHSIVEIQSSDRANVLIIRGQGNSFCAGSDLVEFSRMSLHEIEESFDLMEKAITALERITIPTIASVSGVSMGAGFILALACDLRIGSDLAKFGIPVGRLGITIPQKFTNRIIDLLGPSRTKDFVYTGRTFEGEEAYRLGLLNYFVPSHELNNATIRLANKLQNQSSASLRAIKQTVALKTQSTEMPWNDRGFPYYVDQQDFAEGVKAFIEKRNPRFNRFDRRNRP